MTRTTHHRRPWALAGLAALLVVGSVPAATALRTTSAAAATAAPGDGTTSVTAGASCWGIKQQYPTSGTGTYWLFTRSMDRPAQFACDMTTAGGGWVLVARGREGWTFSPNGQGSPATVRSPIDGPGAFAPAALDATTIDDLVDHTSIGALPGGIRLERARSTNGAVRQDYRLFPKNRSWTWNLQIGQLLNRAEISGLVYHGSNTKDTYSSLAGQTTNDLKGVNDSRRLFTYAWSLHGSKKGFAYGATVAGSPRATSYLWAQGTEAHALPFTRVWINPHLPNSALPSTPIPATGFAAAPEPPALKNRSELAPWGVAGYNHDYEDTITPWDDNVMVVKVYGDRVYVGGRFTGVQHGPGATPIAQQSLAAFDLDGNWISTFRPRINGRVWDLTMTADGKLIVGGDFNSINGAIDTSALAALDPITGAVNTAWKGSATRTGGGNAIVRALDSQGDWIYAAGRFTSFKGGTSAPITVDSAISMRTSNGSPGGWRPRLNGSAVKVDVANAGDRVYLAGFFNAVNANTNHGFHAITSISTGAPVAGIGPFLPSTGTKSTTRYQESVGESGSNILVGGSQHSFQMYDRNRTKLIDSTITRSGGDTQAIATIGGYIYFACHCMNYVYSGSNSWNPGPQNYRAIDPIRMIGRVDAKTFDYDTTWFPDGTKGINDAGIWSISSDKRDCVWVGGDLVRGAYSGNAATDYLGGFARFCPTDSVVPTTPSNLRATPASGSVTLAWNGSTDASGTVSYDVYRDDRVIATVFGTTYTAPAATGDRGSHRYTVRAVDARGNRSASPAPVTSAASGVIPTSTASTTTAAPTTTTTTTTTTP